MRVSVPRAALQLALFVVAGAVLYCAAQTPDLLLPASTPLHFIVYGDIRFTDPANTGASDPVRRELLVKKIAQEKPAFLVISGDLVLRGDNPADWNRWEEGTQPWRDAGIPVYPILGNHDVGRALEPALANWFEHQPQLQHKRWYTVQAGTLYFVMLDSSADAPGGEEWTWLEDRLGHIPAGTQFVFFVMHHPPYTQSSEHLVGGGHSARATEQKLATLLEERQAKLGIPFIAVAGHVHNYERYEHGGVTYLVSGGGGATPYMVERTPGDHYTDHGATYHYCDFTLDRGKLAMKMVKLELAGDQAKWTVRDSFELTAAKKAKAARK